jgi:putative aldouronate transport system substrate-binding protein
MKIKIGINKGTAITGMLVASVLVASGCNGSSGSPTPSTAGQAGQKDAVATPEKRGSISMSLYDRGNVPAEEGTIDNNRWTKWLNEKGPANIKYVPIPRFESQQKFNVLFASGAAPDLILEFDRSYLGQLYNQKQLMPLDDLIAKSSTEYKKRLEQYPAIKKATTMPDGKMYFLARPYNLDPQQFLYVRADWLKKLNLPIPTTAEEMLAVGKAFTEQDPDGNGKKDTQGIGLSFTSGTVLNYMFGNGFTLSGSGQNPWILDNGKVVHDWERLKAALAYQKKIYDAGYTDKDFIADKNGQNQWQGGH